MNCCSAWIQPGWLRVSIGWVLLQMAACIGISKAVADGPTPPRSPITAMVWDDNGGRILAISDSQVLALDPETQVTRPLFTAGMEKILTLALAPNGLELLVAGGDPGQVGVMEQRAWPSGDLINSWSDREDVVTHVEYASDGKRWLEAGWDGRVNIRRRDGSVEQCFSGHSRSVLTAEFLDASQLVASAGVDPSIKIWESSSGQLVRSMDNHVDQVIAMVASEDPSDPSQPFLISASRDGTVRLWKPGIGRLIRFAKLESAPTHLCTLRSGLQVAVATAERAIVRIDMESLEMRSLLPASEARIEAMLLQPDGEGLWVWRSTGVLRIDLREP